jgi:hypothetical protein
MDDLNVTVSRKLLVITPLEIKAKNDRTIYNLIGFPALNFSYMYLYYEPETDNTRKVVANQDGVLVYEQLNAAEIEAIESQLNLLNNETYLATFLEQYEKKSEPFVGDPAAPAVEDEPTVFYVAADKINTGNKPRNQLNPGEIEVTEDQIKSKGFSNSVVPDSIWDDAQAKFVGKTYKDKRAFAYYDQLKYNDQFAAIWEFIKASGIPLPAETQAALDKITAIKAANPKA